MRWSRVSGYARRTLTYAARYATASVDLLDDRPDRLRGSNREYRRFVVVGHQRSGSSMLIQALHRHSQIVAFGELFFPGLVGQNVPGFDNRLAELRALRDRFPAEFLDRLVFAGYPESVHAVGFKLFPEQLAPRRFSVVEASLRSDRDLAVVQLQREDLLAAFASLQVALADDNYGIRHSGERSSTTVRPSPLECEAYFEERRRYSAAAGAMFGHLDVLELSYEKLAADPEPTMARVQAFLGVESEDPKITSVKQEVRPLDEVLENFDELRRHFRGTEHAVLFDR